MNKLYCSAAIILGLCLPDMTIADAATSQKIFSGSVTAISATQITFVSGSGAYYTVQTQNIPFMRKYGLAMQLSERMIADKIQVTGIARPDNSIAATNIRDMSLYAHHTTMSGKIVQVFPLNSSFTAQIRQQTQTVQVGANTKIQKNSSPATLWDLLPGMGVTVTGSWDRPGGTVTATEVLGSLRMINIYISGQLVMKGGDSLTVISNNTMYGIDTASAKFESKNGKGIPMSQLTMGETIKIWGKHISGSTEIIATVVKSGSTTK